MKFIYFIHEIDSEEYKIGFSANPMQRKCSLQTARSKPLKIAAQIPTEFGRKTESSLHRALQQYHVGGEWFVLDDDAFEFAKETCMKIEEGYKTLKKMNNPFI